MYKKSVIKRHIKTLIGGVNNELSYALQIEQDNHPIKSRRDNVLDDALLGEFESVANS